MNLFESECESLKIINAVGYSTRVAGSKPVPEVIAAMAAAQNAFFEIDDLLELASRVISEETGAEAGIVTCGAAAGLTLATAAILAGDDISIMEALPDTSALTRNEFLYPSRGYYDYDHPVRAAGGKLREFSFKGADWEARLAAAFNEHLAGVIYVWKHREDAPLIKRVAELCARSGIPFVLDAAMALPPEENLRALVGWGPDLIVLSGGKHLGGPQNSGLLFGREKFIRSAWLQMVDMDVRAPSWSRLNLLADNILTQPPRHGIGRGYKIGKDTVVGCLAALRLYHKRDFAAERNRWHQICRELVQNIPSNDEFQLEYLPENGTGQYPTVRITARQPERLIRLKQQLKEQKPKIILAEHEQNDAVSYVYPLCLSLDEANILTQRLLAAMSYDS